MAGDWNVTLPADHTLVGSIPGEIRDVLSSTKQVFAKEHVSPSTSSAGGEHVKGSARIYLDSAATGVDPAGNALATSDTSDNGRLQVLTGASNALQVYIGTSAGISTGFENIACRRVYLADTMNANSLPIVGLPAASQSGSPVHIGQLDTAYFTLVTPYTGAVLKTKFVSTYLAASGQDGVTVLTMRGKDDFLGAWVEKDNNTSYLAATAGFVCGIGSASSMAYGLSDGSNPPTTVRSGNCGHESVYPGPFMMPVKKGDYWKVTGCTTAYWIPLGA